MSVTGDEQDYSYQGSESLVSSRLEVLLDDLCPFPHQERKQLATNIWVLQETLEQPVDRFEQLAFVTPRDEERGGQYVAMVARLVTDEHFHIIQRGPCADSGVMAAWEGFRKMVEKSLHAYFRESASDDELSYERRL